MNHPEHGLIRDMEFGSLKLRVTYSHYPATPAHSEKGVPIDPPHGAFNEVTAVTISGTDISLFDLIEEMDGFSLIEAQLAMSEFNLQSEGNEDE